MHVALFGLQGPIQVQGDRFDGVMPRGGGNHDRALADILTFVTHAWGAPGTVPAFTAEEVQAARKTALTAAAVHAERDRLHVR